MSCPNEDHGFNWRKSLVMKLKRMGRDDEIPENIFFKLPNGQFHPIPITLIDDYNGIISEFKLSTDDLPIQGPSPKRKTAIKMLPNNEVLATECRKISALYAQSMKPEAQRQLGNLVKEINSKSVLNLPESVLNAIPVALQKQRAEYETNGPHIDSKKLAALLHIHESPHRSPSKRSKVGRSPPAVVFEDDVSSESSMDSTVMHGVGTSISGITTSTKSTKNSRRSTSTSTYSSRNIKHQKCHHTGCSCKHRIIDRGCCDVCRIYFRCECGDCKYMAGQERAIPAMENEKEKKKIILEVEAQAFSKLADSKRMGYIYDRRKDTVEKISITGREIHRWIVGDKIKSPILSCEKAFIRFYETSSRTLHRMRGEGTGSIVDKGVRTIDSSRNSDVLASITSKMCRKSLDRKSVV